MNKGVMMTEPFNKALAIRCDENILKQQIEMFDNDTFLTSLLNEIPDLILILNQTRQVVFANCEVFKFLEIETKDYIYGKRPGEIFDCNHSIETTGGCGSSEACQFCGALLTIQAGLDKKKVQNECKIFKYKTKEAMDLKVNSSFLEKGNEVFAIFTIYDISDIKRKQVFERIFFHDILNIASVISSISILLSDSSPEEYTEYSNMLVRSSHQLIDEISAQRELASAEKGDMNVDSLAINTEHLINDIITMTTHYFYVKNKKVILDETSEFGTIKTDPTIINRVIINLIKNAMEAEPENSIIKVGTKIVDNNFVCWVHNTSFIPKEIQLQLFMRSFSTKGVGRGIGTYSVKLLIEKYLKGKVYFESSEENGTTFFVMHPSL